MQLQPKRLYSLAGLPTSAEAPPPTNARSWARCIQPSTHADLHRLTSSESHRYPLGITSAIESERIVAIHDR